MLFYRSYSEALTGFPQELSAAVAGAAKTLLESKHLYQSVTVDVSALTASAAARTETRGKEHFSKWAADAANWPWIVSDRTSFPALLAAMSTNVDSSRVSWQAPDIKSYCRRCDRIEPFNSVDATNFLAHSSPLSGGPVHDKTRRQVYVLSYLCQSCKIVPEVFLVQRDGKKLTLCGRSPMEKVAVNRAVPREVSSFVSGAKIAHSSGQTLAGLFLLRTTIEQWARAFSPDVEKADQAIENYMAQLPSDFNVRFPSVRSMYSDLSAAIHRADASSDLFEATSHRLDEHFEARRLFKLGAPPLRSP